MKRDEIAEIMRESIKNAVSNEPGIKRMPKVFYADKVLALLTQLPPERDVNTVIDWLNSHDMHEEAKQIEDISSKCKCTACNPAAS